MGARLVRYAVAVGIVVVTLAIDVALSSAGLKHTLVLLPVAVVVSAWYGGRGPGLLATFGAALSADIVLLPPFGIGASTGDLIGLVVLVAEGILIVEVTVALRRARARAAAEAARADQARREAATALHMREELITLWSEKLHGPFGQFAAGVRDAREALERGEQAQALGTLQSLGHDVELIERTAEHWGGRADAGT